MAGIKISELSVGDWVELAGRPKRISSVLETPMGGIVRCQNQTITAFVEHISPIPLTPKILEKNGISKTYESDEYAVYKGEGFNVTEYYTELWEFERHRNRLMIRYVHQLQNALRLAGVEKEIEV